MKALTSQCGGQATCCYDVRSQGSVEELPTAEVVGDGNVVTKDMFCLLLQFVKSEQKSDIPWTSLHAKGSGMSGFTADTVVVVALEV